MKATARRRFAATADIGMTCKRTPANLARYIFSFSVNHNKFIDAPGESGDSFLFLHVNQR